MIHKGNAQVGDVAWWRPDKNTLWSEDYSVVAVGLMNSSGYPLNVRIRNSAGLERDVSPFPCTGHNFANKEEVLLIPAELPMAVKKQLERYPHLLAARDGGNADDERFTLLCRRCWHPLVIEIRTVETADLHYRDDMFLECKPCMEESSSVVHCECREGDEGEYDIDFEQYY